MEFLRNFFKFTTKITMFRFEPSNYGGWWKNIKPLYKYRWYRQIVGGKWFCSINLINNYGYYRNWRRNLPIEDILVRIEINRPFRYKWFIDKHSFAVKFRSTEIKYFYTYKEIQKFWGVSSKIVLVEE